MRCSKAARASPRSTTSRRATSRSDPDGAIPPRYWRAVPGPPSGRISHDGDLPMSCPNRPASRIPRMPVPVRHDHDLIDHDEVDWTRVVGTRFVIRQRMTYVYDGPIHHLRHRLMVVPPARHGDQVRLDHGVEVSGAARSGRPQDGQVRQPPHRRPGGPGGGGDRVRDVGRWPNGWRPTDPSGWGRTASTTRACSSRRRSPGPTTPWRTPPTASWPAGRRAPTWPATSTRGSTG